MENIDLEGRLEKVYIKHPGNGISGFANYKGERVLISHGKNYARKECIIKFDLRQPKTDSITANFITARIPRNFRSLEKEEYILLGIWHNYMEKEGEYPTLHEINKYYDPGQMLWALFIEKNTLNSEGGIKITSKGKRKIGFDLYNIKRYLPYPYSGSRVVLTENEKTMKKMYAIIINSDLQPIVMEPLA